MFEMEDKISYALADVELKSGWRSEAIQSHHGSAKSLWIQLEIERCFDLPGASEAASTSAPLFHAV